MGAGLDLPQCEEMEQLGEFKLATTEDELFRDLHRDGHEFLVEQGHIPRSARSHYQLPGLNAVKITATEPDGTVIGTFYVRTDDQMKVAEVYRPWPQEV